VYLETEATASSFIEGMEPDKVKNGWNRIVGKDRNAWAPEANASLPQWVEIKLEKPSPLNTLHVAFEDNKNLVVSFDVEVGGPQNWKQVARVTDNKLRRRVITFEPTTAASIRLVMTRSRRPFAVCEVRLYGEPTDNTS
jgi:hypothetical protein